MAVKLPEDNTDLFFANNKYILRTFWYKYIQYLACMVHRGVFALLPVQRTSTLSQNITIVLNIKFDMNFEDSAKKQPKNMVDEDLVILGISRTQRMTHQHDFCLSFRQY